MERASRLVKRIDTSAGAYRQRLFTSIELDERETTTTRRNEATKTNGVSLEVTAAARFARDQ
jgi:hypothetical protein